MLEYFQKIVAKHTEPGRRPGFFVVVEIYRCNITTFSIKCRFPELQPMFIYEI